MTNSQRLADVRNCFCRWISDQKENASRQSGGPSDSVNSVKIIAESILIRDGFFVGRTLKTAFHRAVWFIEEDELKIYSADGKLLQVMRGGEIDPVESNDSGSLILKMPEMQLQRKLEDNQRRAA